jgi:hypothetical protein
MPPEYVLEGVLSVKYDVYSFGITILETISSMCRFEPALSQASVEWVRSFYTQILCNMGNNSFYPVS